MMGKVWLVGAGPGDAGLMTRKGYEVLKEAEVVIYDSLVSDSILCMMPRDAIRIDAGKRAGKHTLPQEETNELILNYALKGYRVVRLKGGDPFLFGRGGEELELLVEKGVSYEIVPGVTSAIAVPAYNGIPVTHRNLASSVHIITAHHKKDSKERIDYESLVKMGGTFVFLMGFAALEEIVQGLRNNSLDENTPIAVLSEGTTSNQKKVVGSLIDICKKVEEAKLNPPAIVVVGKVSGLAERFSWWEKKPLSSCRILLTRPGKRMHRLSEELYKLGAQVVEEPASQIVPIAGNSLLEEALENIDRYDWLVFTSPSGVEVFFDKLIEYKFDIRKLCKLKVAAMGDGTRRSLLEKGIFVDCMPEEYNGRALGWAIAKEALANERIMLARARIGNNDILKELEDFKVDDIAIYDTLPNRVEVVDVSKEITDGDIDYIVFTSSSSVDFWVETHAGLDFSKVEAVCIGNKTADRAKSYGMSCHVAKEASVEGLIALILELRND